MARNPVTPPYEANRAYARAMDDADPLREFRDQFNFPESRDGNAPVYMCGNSLGLQPKLAARYVEEELEDWAKFGVEGHFRARRAWMPYHRLLTDGLANLTGSAANEVVAMNTLTVNLHLLMTTFYRPTETRNKILVEATAFPSDRFAVMSQLQLHGYDPRNDLLEWQPRGERLELADLQDMLEEHGDDIAMMLLPGVQYYNGQVLDMPALCVLAADCGCTIGLDLAHAVGNIPLELHNWAPDFAAWCSYKYMNGGPGAVGGAFVHSKHLDADGSEQLLGWWGHAESSRFLMAPTFTPAAGAELWQLSNPPILSLAPVLASLEIFAQAGIDRLRSKSILLTGYLDFLLQRRFHERVRSMTPDDARGCQLSLVVAAAQHDPREIFRRLEASNVIADWREPDVIRVSPAPLYNSFEDVFEFSERLEAAMT